MEDVMRYVYLAAAIAAAALSFEVDKVNLGTVLTLSLAGITFALLTVSETVRVRS